MTMPSLISNYRHKVLETQFKKAYSALSQAVIPVQSEFLSCPAASSTEIRDFLFSQFVHVDKINYISRSSFKTYNNNVTTLRIHPNCLHSGYAVKSPDGFLISFCTNATFGNMISIDTNGVNKGPNSYGHDLFFFYLDLNNCNLKPMTAQWRDCTEDDRDCANASDSYFGYKWTDGNCSKESDASDNGFACTQYAIANTCPDGSGKGYFDCLP